MKQLHDGSFVADNIPTKIISGERYLLSEDDVIAQAQQATENRLAAIAAYPDHLYQEKLDGGFSYNGIHIETNPQARSMINGAVTRAILDNDTALEYEYFPTGGAPFSMSNAVFIAVGRAIADHAQRCLKAQDAVKSNIGNYATLQEVKEAFDAAYTA